MHNFKNFNMLQKQFCYYLPSINVTFLIFHDFPVVSPCCPRGWCPKPQATTPPSGCWTKPPMWFGIVWKQARFWELFFSASGKEMRHLCGIFWLDWFMDGCREASQTDFGEWVGAAPSMSQKGSLMLRKKYGCKPAQKIAKNKSVLGTYMAQLTCFEWELRHVSPALCLWHRWRNSRNWATYFWGEQIEKENAFGFPTCG